MGIFDSMKSRLGFGNPNNNNRDWGNEEYSEEYYEEGYDGGGGHRSDYGSSQNEGYGGGYDDYSDRPSAMRAFGVDRADYYNDNHSPLVTQSDVRSQPLMSNVPTGHVRDRIPAPRAYVRSTQKPVDAIQEDEMSAIKNGLARSPNSFAQLHDARLRIEDSGKIVALRGDSSMDSTGVMRDQGGGGYGRAAAASGQARQRVLRRVEHILPVTYSDAEKIALELKKGAVVVLDLRATRPDLAKRILDFSFGVASALEGQVERYIDRVYLFTCNGAAVDSERSAIRV